VVQGVKTPCTVQGVIFVQLKFKFFKIYFKIYFKYITFSNYDLYVVFNEINYAKIKK
jgi:hypothetical protein